MKLSALSSSGRLDFLEVTIIAAAFFVVFFPVRAEGSNPGFKFSPTASHVPIKQGGTATDVFLFTTSGPFTGNISMVISGLPSFITASWSGDPVRPSGGSGAATLTLSPSATASPNWYPFTVTASGDGLKISETYTVEVEPSDGLQTQLSSPALSLEPLGAATMLVSATPQHGVKVPTGAAGASATIVSTLPNGIAALWSAPTVTPTGEVNWTLTLTAGSAVETGDYPVELSVEITDKNSGLVYAMSPGFPLLVSLMAEVNIGTTPGLKIPPSFLGLSHEWGVAQNMMGSSAGGVNNLYRQLLTNLTVYGSGPINLRIGGDSTDYTGAPTATTVEPFAEVAKALGSHFELGVNLGSNNVALANEQAAAYIEQMPAGSVDAIEIGNEPDEYYKNGLRAASYTVADYYTDFDTWKESILPILPAGTKLMGAAWAFYGTMQKNVASYEAQEASSLAVFSQHCYGTNPQSNPTTESLLSPGAASFVPQQVASSVIVTHANGLPFRMGETGPISDEGVAGVSDSFAAGLWGLDAMFGFANVGVDGVNFLTGGGNPDSPFQFTVTYSGSQANYALQSVSPLYYAMLMFQVAVGPGAQMLPVSLNTPANLTAWATVPVGRTPRVAIINKDLTQTGTVAITMPGYKQAQVLLLTAPSYTSTAGVTFAGQTLDGSTTGMMHGTKTEQTISSVNGIFYLPMAITSAALVIFKN